MPCQGFKKYISQSIALIKKFIKQKLFFIKIVKFFVKNFLLSNAFLRFTKIYFRNFSFFKKVYEIEIIPHKKCLTFCK